MITETDDIARALDVAARHWPHAKGKRSELLRLIINAGVKAVEDDEAQIAQMRAQAVQRLARDFDGMWPADWREQRDAEWPE